MNALLAKIRAALGPLASAEVHSTAGLVGGALELANHEWHYALAGGTYAAIVRVIDALAPLFANGANVPALSGKQATADRAPDPGPRQATMSAGR